MRVMVSVEGGFELRSAGPVHRAAARLRAMRCDLELAAGAAPEDSLRLAIHARRILLPRSRAEVAGELRHLADCARDRGLRRHRAPVRWSSVEAARTQLETVADRLASGGPVSPQTMSAVRLLLSDAAGPLFVTGIRSDLAGELRTALGLADRLEPARCRPGGPGGSSSSPRPWRPAY